MAKQILDGMDDEKNPGGIYSYYVVNKTTKWALQLSMFFIGCFITYLMFNYLLIGAHWLQIALYASLPCLPLIVMPRSEEWMYRPWQRQSQKVEYNFTD